MKKHAASGRTWSTWQVSLVSLLAAQLIVGCGKKSDDKSEESAAGGSPTDEQGQDPNTVTPGVSGGIPVTGTLALSAGLTDGGSVTHVVALNTSSGETFAAEVADDGSFSINIAPDEPWVLSYIDSTKTGADMIVSRFGSDTLDTLNAAEGSDAIAMGDVDASAEKATTTTSHSDLLTATGMSAEAAEEFGAVDDVSLRYLNPDIDGNGKVDATENVSYQLDFHNRFMAKTAGGTDIQMADLKNAFPPDDVVFHFTGSGIMPWFDKKLFATEVTDYSWTFSVDATTGTNGGVPCDGYAAGTVLPAGEACNKTMSTAENNGMPGIELAAAVPGTYKLVAGGKTFTWTNVAVSDFSAGEGFVALFMKYDVDTNDKLQSVSYKWMRKNAAGAYELASAEYLKLVVKEAKGYVSLKVDGSSSGKGIGVSIPGTPEGKVLLSDKDLVHAEGFDEAQMRNGISWSRVLENPGVSYDDKLGMRFFF